MSTVLKGIIPLAIIGEQAYWRILGSNGYDQDTAKYIKDSHRAAILRELADEAEIQRGENGAKA